MTTELRLILALCLMTGAWLITFLLLIRALNRILLLHTVLAEGSVVLQRADSILREQDAIIYATAQMLPTFDGSVSAEEN